MDFEVLVVGGGPAGATAANFLVKEGIDTCLIERNLQLEKSCGGGIPSAGLKDLNLLDEVVKNLRFNSIKKLTINPPFSEAIEVEFRNCEILIFNRLEFDSFLRQLAKKNGVNIIEGELISIEEGKNIKALVKTKNGKHFTIHCKYLIGADGINSRVCSLAGINKPNFLWTISFQIPSTNLEKIDCCEFWFGSSHASFFYSWVFPGYNYLSIGTGAEKVSILRNLIDNFIKKRFSSLDTSKIKFRAFKIPRWKRGIFHKKNIILCGDALGTVMPVTFEGIYYAMKSAQFASEAIKQKKLEIYEQLWNDRFGRQFSIMKKFQDHIFGNDNRIDKWLNIHRDPHIQELAMALWLRKEKKKQLLPLYLKAFGSIISRIDLSQVKINM